MKKIIVLVIAVLAIVSLVGCSKNVETQPKNDENQSEIIENTSPIDEVNQEDNNEGLITEENQGNTENEKYFDESLLNIYSDSQIISLPGNGTTGYKWNYSFSNEQIIEVSGEQFVSNDNTGTLAGAGGVYSYTLKGINEGETELTYVYLRPWEGESSIIKRVTFKLKVDSDLNVAVIEEI